MFSQRELKNALQLLQVKQDKLKEEKHTSDQTVEYIKVNILKLLNICETSPLKITHTHTMLVKLPTQYTEMSWGPCGGCQYGSNVGCHLQDPLGFIWVPAEHTVDPSVAQS